ncbi:MAG: hypothetical protein AMXMBFR59_38540 [Rhodanobacteraceae bacterium]
MSTEFRITLALTVRGPLLCKSNDRLGFGIDSHSLLRPDDQGRPCAAIAGSHIKGQLRHALQQLLGYGAAPPGLDASALRRWFGPPVPPEGEPDDWEPQRAGLRFDPYWLAPPASEADRQHTLHRIRISEETGAVERGALMVIETPLASGEEAVFQGGIALTATPEEAENVSHWLGKAAAFISAVGALKGIGFGQVSAATATVRPVTHTIEPVDVPVQATLWLSFGLDRPFCFARPGRGRGNHFESLPYVPGAAIKGALLAAATRLAGTGGQAGQDADTLLANANRIGFTHARVLGTDGARSAELPQSLVVANGAFFDLARFPEPALIDGVAPAFQIDWKHADEKAAIDRFAPAQHLDARLIVRTAIDPDRGAARESALFAMRTLDPGPHRFGAWLHWHEESGAAPPAAVYAALQRLLPQSLNHLGKTKASATDVRCEPRPHPRACASDDGRWIVSLQSAAALLPDCPGLPFANGGEALHRHYAEAWHRLSDGALELAHFFARQEVVGGRYLWGRFWNKRGGTYRPQLLTQAGSVFVLSAPAARREQAATLLSRWMQTGLPTEQLLPKHACGWDRNPYQPQNGYGEIRVNDPLHADPALRPVNRQILAISQEVRA